MEFWILEWGAIANCFPNIMYVLRRNVFDRKSIPMIGSSIEMICLFFFYFALQSIYKRTIPRS